MIILNGWTDFWQKIGNFFKDFFNGLYYYWIDPKAGDPPSNDTPFLITFLIALIVLVIGYFLIKILCRILNRIFKINKKSFVKERTFKKFLVNTIKTVLYVVLFIFFLGILGVNLNGVTTIFSSAILAIGLSLQDVIGNFASGLIILTSKPFVIGDYVLFNQQGIEGTVTDVRFLTTFLETIDKQVVVIPNKNVTSTSLTNYSTNPVRRVNITIGVSYDSDIELVKSTLLKVAASDKRVLKDPKAEVKLVEFDSSSLQFSLRCYVPNDYYWDMLFSFNETLLNYFRKNKIQIPFQRIDIYDVNGKKINLNKSPTPRKTVSKNTTSNKRG